MRNNASKKLGRTGFSLVEVILALGIFSFSIVAMLSILGGSHKNTLSLMSLDSMVAVRNVVGSAISSLPATTIQAIPEGAGESTDRPELFVWLLQESSSGYAITNTTNLTSVASATSTGDGRIYRARLYRALTEHDGSEAEWSHQQAAYPLRVQLDAFAAGMYSPTAKPLESSTFNAVWNAR